MHTREWVGIEFVSGGVICVCVCKEHFNVYLLTVLVFVEAVTNVCNLMYSLRSFATFSDFICNVIKPRYDIYICI